MATIPVNPKTKFAQSIISLNQNAVQLMDMCTDIEGIYFDCGYNSGGVDEITDEDLTDYNVTAAQIASFITLAQQFNNLFKNAAVTTGDYGVTVNQLRNAGR